jgi:hypothetical protein
MENTTFSNVMSDDIALDPLLDFFELRTYNDQQAFLNWMAADSERFRLTRIEALTSFVNRRNDDYPDGIWYEATIPIYDTIVDWLSFNVAFMRRIAGDYYEMYTHGSYHYLIEKVYVERFAYPVYIVVADSQGPTENGIHNISPQELASVNNLILEIGETNLQSFSNAIIASAFPDWSIEKILIQYPHQERYSHVVLRSFTMPNSPPPLPTTLYKIVDPLASKVFYAYVNENNVFIPIEAANPTYSTIDYFANTNGSDKELETFVKVLTNELVINGVISPTQYLQNMASLIAPIEAQAQVTQGRHSMGVGYAYQGIKTIVSTDTNKVFTPTSDYCFIKCIHYYLTNILNVTTIEISTKGLFPDYTPLTTLRQRCIDTISNICLDSCPSRGLISKTKCTKICKEYRRYRYYHNQGFNMPSEYKVTKNSDGTISYNLTSNTLASYNGKNLATADRNPHYGIGLLQLCSSNKPGRELYHAVLLKFDKNNKLAQGHVIRSNYFNNEDFSFQLTTDKDLIPESVGVRIPKAKKTPPFVIVWDMETYTKSDIQDPPFKNNVSDFINEDAKYKEKLNYINPESHTGIKKEQIPYAIGYAILYLEYPIDKQIEGLKATYKEVLLTHPTENLIDKFLEALYKDTNIPFVKDKIILYAHNGGRFDTIFVKKASPTYCTFESQIVKGSQIKQLDLMVPCKQVAATGIQAKYFSFKDSQPFTLYGLSQCCKTYQTSNQKQSFDIADWSYSKYKYFESLLPTVDYGDKQKDNITYQNYNWRYYLYYDVISLGEIVSKVDALYLKFGVSIHWVTGLAGIAWRVMANECYALRKLSVPKSRSLISFMRQGYYGGRVLHWCKEYSLTEDQIANLSTNNEGLVSLDINSLYPAAMSIGKFPIGKPQVLNLKLIHDYIHLAHHHIKYTSYFHYIDTNYPHYMIEAIIRVPNIRYAYHPYRTENGCVIYPSNQIIQGVYTEVAIREMLKDGYEVIEVIRGITWSKSNRIFTDFIIKMYRERNRYKSLGQHHAAYILNEAIKNILNSSYGKFAEMIKDISYFLSTDGADEECLSINSKSSTQALNNGQKEIKEALERPKVDKPLYIAAYITDYARAIVNEYIRLIKPENIFYSDTDSLYVPKACLTNIPLSTELGMFKNDYGDSVVITRAIFLDLKRYYLEKYDMKSDPSKARSITAKFNGLSFDRINSIRSNKLNLDYDNDYTNTVLGIYTHLLHQSSTPRPYKLLSRRYEPGDEYTPEDKAIVKQNQILKVQYLRTQNDELSFIISKWNRGQDSIHIVLTEMFFQVDPEMRGDWINNQFYSKGFSHSEHIHNPLSNPFWNSPENRVGYLKSLCQETKFLGFNFEETNVINKHLTREEKLEVGFRYHSTRPLSVDLTSNPSLYNMSTIPILTYHHKQPEAEKKVLTEFFLVKSQDSPLEEPKILHLPSNHEITVGEDISEDGSKKLIKHKVGYEITELSRVMFFYTDIKLLYQVVEPLIAYSETPENIARWGFNSVDIETLKRRVERIASLSYVRKEGERWVRMD